MSERKLSSDQYRTAAVSHLNNCTQMRMRLKRGVDYGSALVDGPEVKYTCRKRLKNSLRRIYRKTWSDSIVLIAVQKVYIQYLLIVVSSQEFINLFAEEKTTKIINILMKKIFQWVGCTHILHMLYNKHKCMSSRGFFFSAENPFKGMKKL